LTEMRMPGEKSENRETDKTLIGTRA